jgi:predicted RNA-binding Zn ribbon-like protein
MSLRAPAGEWQFHLAGDALCLDFANTVSWRRSSRPIERLASHTDLVAWARQSALISANDALALNRAAAANPLQAARRLAAARRLREVVFRIFAAVSEGRVPDDRDLLCLNAELRSAYAHRRLVREGSRYRWRAVETRPDIVRVLAEVARSAAELLTSADRERVGQCHGADCRWLFVDRTRNRSRRWCDMAVCGNRAKARRHYHQRRRVP